MRTLVADIGRQGPALVALGCPRRCRLEVIERMLDHLRIAVNLACLGVFLFHRYQVLFVRLRCFGAGEVVDFCTDPYAVRSRDPAVEGRTGFFTPRPLQHLLLSSFAAAACVPGRLGTLPAAWPSDPCLARRHRWTRPIPSVPTGSAPTDPKLLRTTAVPVLSATARGIAHCG